MFYTSGMSEFVDALSRGPLKRAVEMLRSGDVIPDSRYFLENGADAPVLYIAVTHGRYAIAKEMVQMGASVDDYAERCGVKYPLLVYGMATKDETAVSYFFNHGADVYKAASDGTDALYWACVNGYTNIVSRLIGMGHDVNKYYKDDK